MKRTLRSACIVICLFAALLVPTGWTEAARDSTVRIGVQEKLGQQVARDAVFQGEDGRSIVVGDLIRRPTVISLVYHRCGHTCPALLTGLADLLGKVDLVPGKDFSLLTISFDELDTPEVARDRKRNYIAAIGKPFPESEWHFLTGDSGNIRKFTDSVGFEFTREKDGFNHPVVLVVTSPEGKIVRYLYGKNFLPFDLKMAVTEAAQGKVGLSVQRLLLFCYSYDPPGRSYVFNILRVYGTVMILIVVSLFIYLTVTKKKKER
jgi:protein SCO1/2